MSTLPAALLLLAALLVPAEGLAADVPLAARPVAASASSAASASWTTGTTFSAAAPGTTGLTAWRLEQFLGRRAFVPAPPAARAARLTELLAARPDDPALTLELAYVRVQLGEYEVARKLVEQRVEKAQPGEARAAALGELAAFLHGRLAIADEFLTLRGQLGELPARKRRPVYERMLELLDTFRLQQFDLLALHRERVEAFPADWPARQALLVELGRRASAEASLKALDEAQQAFPGRRRELLAMRRDTLMRQDLPGGGLPSGGRLEAVREAYLAASLPGAGADLDAGVLDDFLDWLRGRRELESFRKRLEAQSREGRLGAAEAIVLSWALASENRAQEAQQALDGLGRGVRTALGRDALGQLEARLERKPEAARLFLGAYLESTDPATREGALYHLFQVLKDDPSALGPLAPDPVGALVSPGRVDSRPGTVGGLLSLAFNATGSVSRLEELRSASRTWSGQGSLLALSRAMSTEFLTSARGHEVFLSSVEFLATAGEHARAARLIEERLAVLNPPPERKFALRLRRAAALRAAGKRQDEWAEYRALLAEAATESSEASNPGPAAPVEDEPGEGTGAVTRGPGSPSPEPRVSSPAARRERVFDLLAASLADAGRHEDVLRLYWDELERHPGDATLYEKFLRYLSSYKLVEAELQVYERAARAFRDRSWFHRLARWYLSHKRRDAYEQLCQRVLGLFTAPELKAYLAEFARQGSAPSSQADNRLYLALYQEALRRYPHELAFVTGLENFYRARSSTGELADLLAVYHFSDRQLALRHLQELSRTGALAAATARASREKSVAARWFLADTLDWDCRFEEALPVHRTLLADFPGDRRRPLRVAALERSFGRPADGGKVLEQARERWPGDAELLTLAGELALEAGDSAGATSHWMRLVESRPGDPARYLEAATVFWDYFDYPRAAALLQRAREVTGDSTLHANRLAAVHESAGDFEKAIDEYIQVLWKVDLWDQEARRRLNYLSRARKLKPTVAARFQKLLGEHPGEPRLVAACAEWLDLVEDADGKGRLYLEAIEKTRDYDLLESICAHFENAGLAVPATRALERLLELSGGERDLRLRLTASLERRGERDRARTTLQEGVALGRKGQAAGEGTGALVSALSDLAAFEERNGAGESMFTSLDEAARLATAPRRKELRQRLARLQLAAGREADSRATLQALLVEEPLDADLFHDLALLAVKAKDSAGLGALYDQAIAAVRRAPLAVADRKARIARLRLDLAGELLELGLPAAAIDQHIELVNREPLDETVLRRAYDVAAKAGQVARLEDAFRKTSATSFKDYRWNVVLARICEFDRRLEAAVGEYSKAIALEPQRLELLQARASLLVKVARYREAADEYRQIYRLDNRNTSWLQTVARMLAMSGDLKGAGEELTSFVKLGSQDSRARLAAARVHDDWGQAAETLAEAREALGLERGAWRSREVAFDVVAGGLELLARWGGVNAAFDEALAMRQSFDEERGGPSLNHVQVGRLENGVRQLDRFLAERFGELVARYAAGNDLSELRRKAVEAAGGGDELGAALRRMASVSHEGSLELALLEADAAGASAERTAEALESLRAFLAARGWLEREEPVIDSLLVEATGDRRAGLLLRRAVVQHLRAKPEAELASLQAVLTYVYEGRTYYLETGVEEACLRLLKSAGKVDALAAAAASPTLFRINWFLEAGLRDLALAAISAMGREPVWKDAKTLLVRLHAGESGPAVITLFDRLLGPAGIGTSLGTRPDSTKVLVGQPWFWYARKRAEFAAKQADLPTADAYAGALCEEHPKDASRQAELGRWALENRRFEAALARFDCALELSPADISALDGRARALAGMGRTSEAVDCWRRLPAAKNAGPVEALRACRSMSEAGLAAEARRLLEEFILERHRRLGIDALGELLEEYRKGFAPDDWAGPDAFFTKLTQADPGRLELLTLLVDRKLAGGAFAVAYLHRAVEAVSSGAFPNRQVIAEQQLRLATFLRERGDLTGALEAVEAVLKGDPGSEEARAEKTRLLARMWDSGAGAARLDAWLEAATKDCLSEEERVLKLTTVLAEEGRQASADRLLEAHLAARLVENPGDTDTELGLAKVLLRRDRPDEAIRLLQDSVLADLENESLLRRSSELLEEAGRLGPAADFRERLRARRPSDRANVVALAEVFRRSGKPAQGLEMARDVLFGAGSSRADRDAAMAVVGRCVRDGGGKLEAERALCRAAAAKLGEELAGRAEAAILGAVDRKDEQTQTLRALVSKLPDTWAAARDLLQLGEAGSEADARRWWQLSGDPVAALFLFRKLAAAGKCELALAARPLPGTGEFEPYAEPETAESDEDGSSELQTGLEETRGPAYSGADAYALDAAACLAATRRWTSARTVLEIALRLVRDAGAQRALKSRLADVEALRKAYLEREAGRLVLGEGIQN